MRLKSASRLRVSLHWHKPRAGRSTQVGGAPGPLDASNAGHASMRCVRMIGGGAVEDEEDEDEEDEGLRLEIGHAPTRIDAVDLDGVGCLLTGRQGLASSAPPPLAAPPL